MAEKSSTAVASPLMIRTAIIAVIALVILAFGLADQAKNPNHPLFSLYWTD